MGEYLRVAIFNLTVAFYPIIAWPQVFSHQNLANIWDHTITEGGNKNCWVVWVNVTKNCSALKPFKRTHEIKVNSLQEACAKCFVVHLLKFEISQTTWENKTKTKT